MRTEAAAAPLAPTNLMFSEGVAGVTLSWTLPVGGEAPTTVVIEAGSAPGSNNIGSFDVGLITSLTASVSFGTYYVRVRARNADGFSAPSNEVVIRIGGFTCTPLAAPVLSVLVAGANVTLSWSTVVGASSYLISAGTSLGASNIVVLDSGNVGTTLTATAPPGVFFVRVAGRDACGTGAASNEVTFSIGGVAPNPTQLVIVDSPAPVPWSGSPIGRSCTGLANTWFWNSVFTPTFGSGIIYFTHITSVVDGQTTLQQPAVITMEMGPEFGSAPHPRQFCSNQPFQHTLVSTFHGVDEAGRAVSFTLPPVVLLARP